MWPTQRMNNIAEMIDHWLMTLHPLYFFYLLCLTSNVLTLCLFCLSNSGLGCICIICTFSLSRLVLKVGAVNEGFGLHPFFQPENMKFDFVMLLYNDKVLFKVLFNILCNCVGLGGWLLLRVNKTEISRGSIPDLSALLPCLPVSSVWPSASPPALAFVFPKAGLSADHSGRTREAAHLQMLPHSQRASGRFLFSDGFLRFL